METAGVGGTDALITQRSQGQILPPLPTFLDNQIVARSVLDAAASARAARRLPSVSLQPRPASYIVVSGPRPAPSTATAGRARTPWKRTAGHATRRRRNGNG